MLDLLPSRGAEPQHPDEFLGLALDAVDADMALAADVKDEKAVGAEFSGHFRLEDDAGAAVLDLMLPSTLSEAELEDEEAANESDAGSLWSACLLSEAERAADAKPKPADGAASPAPVEPLPLDDVVAGEMSDSPDAMMMLMMDDDDEADPAALQVDGLLTTAALAPIGAPVFGGLNALAAEVAAGKKRRGRKPSLKPKDAKPKRAPPSAAKARLRSYERRSRHKREV